MKKVLFYTLASVAVLLGFNSCLFNDDIGAELNTGTIVGGGVLHSGQADSINYHKTISEAGFNQAYEKLESEGVLGFLLPAQYSMHGGKNGELPGPHAYQFQFNLQIDNYAGYLCAPQNFSGRLASTYYNSEDFNGGARGSFMQVKNSIVPLLNHPEIDSIPEIKAIALLIYNYSAQEVADIYGPFPYADYKKNKQSSPFTYNAVEHIYKTIVNNIDTIVACLNHFDSRPSWYKSHVNGILEYYDRVSGEEKGIMGWIRFANSLKLRMAMNIVKVEPELARRWAEQAVQAGVIEKWQQQFRISPMENGFTHPLLMISNTWNDTRLNASLESILKAYDHPILEFLFAKNSDPIINLKNNSITPENTICVGLRSGIKMLAGQSYDVNFRAAYSKVKSSIGEMPLFLMKLSEVDFLRAEGALRGWNMLGNAETFYNHGIQNAYKGTFLKEFDENWNEISFDGDVYIPKLNDYMGITKARAIEYVDPSDDANNALCQVKVGVKWEDGDDNETKLEKIITQKYIASFPYSFGAWTDLRRTGYPKIFPVLDGDTGDGSIVPGDIIRRIPYSGSDEATKRDILTTGLEALGAPDLQGTRLWWDVNGSNF